MAYLDDDALKARIVSEYEHRLNTKYLRNHWTKELHAIPELASFSFTTKELLVSDFGILLKIARSYDKALSGATEERKTEIKERLRKVFNYDSNYRDNYITPFFREHAEELKLYTCHYCDIAYINSFDYHDPREGWKKKSHFDLDHVIEKSSYPFLALSLFNLVPSCPVCNERLKGVKPLAKTDRILKLLSPTSPKYNFDGSVRITLLPLDEYKRPFIEHPEDYELKFDCHKNKEYNKMVTCFRLNERYDFHKCEALRIKDLKTKYPDANIMTIATMLGYPFDEVKEDIFGLRFIRDGHRCFSKLRQDMLK
jgi:hypothetical protein